MVKLKDYKGWAIEVGEITGEFFSEDIPRRYKTLYELETKIDEIESKRAKSRMLNLPVIDDDGDTYVVTGISFITGGVTGLGKIQRNHMPMYPDIPEVRELIDAIISHENEIKRLKPSLARFSISRSRGNISPENYAEALDVLEREYVARCTLKGKEEK